MGDAQLKAGGHHAPVPRSKDGSVDGRCAMTSFSWAPSHRSIDSTGREGGGLGVSAPPSRAIGGPSWLLGGRHTTPWRTGGHTDMDRQKHASRHTLTQHTNRHNTNTKQANPPIITHPSSHQMVISIAPPATALMDPVPRAKNLNLRPYAANASWHNPAGLLEPFSASLGDPALHLPS